MSCDPTIPGTGKTQRRARPAQMVTSHANIGPRLGQSTSRTTPQAARQPMGWILSSQGC